MKRFLFLSLVFFLLLSFGSCKKKIINDGWEDTMDSGIIKIACDENFKTLMDAQIESFEAHNNYLAFINPIYSNENEVIRLLIEDTVRLALVTRDLNAKEQKTMKGKRMAVRKYLIAFEGIALVINKTNTDSLIGLPTLKKILTGEITEWKQINQDSPLGTIRVIFDNNQSGIKRYILDSVANNKNLSPNLYAMNNSDELINKVSELNNAIGIISYNIINSEVNWNSSELQDNLRLMRIGRDENANLQNTYLPFAGDVNSENYPLWRPLYVLLSDPRMGLSSTFSIFLSREVGQTVILHSGLMPAIVDILGRSVNQSRTVYFHDTNP